MIVCIGAALTMILSTYLTAMITNVWHINASTDVSRFGAQVINGIGFLGAGTIIITGHQQIKGLTTAAGLWATGSIGLAIGIGFYIAAIMAFLVVFLTITLFIHLEKKSKKTETNYCYVELFDSAKTKEFCVIAKQYAEKIDIVPAKSGIANHIGLEFKFKSPEDYESLLLVSGENEDVVVALPVQY